MSFFDDVLSGVTGVPYSYIKRQQQRRDEARHRMMSGGVKQDVEDLISRMNSLDTALQGAEYAVQSDLAEKIAATREKLGEVKNVISKPLDYYNALDEIWTFVSDVRSVGKFTPGEDPVGEAKAYGKAMKSLGKVAARIPLLNIYASFLEEMGDVFAKTVENLVYHTRPNVRNEVERLRVLNGGRSVLD